MLAPIDKAIELDIENLASKLLNQGKLKGYQQCVNKH